MDILKKLGSMRWWFIHSEDAMGYSTGADALITAVEAAVTIEALEHERGPDPRFEYKNGYNQALEDVKQAVIKKLSVTL